MRYLAFLASLLFSLSVAAQGVSPPPRGVPLIKWTPETWESEGKKSAPVSGTYKQCGSYLFTFMPSAEFAQKALIGYRFKGPSSTQVLLRRGADVRILEGGLSTEVNISVPTKDGYVIILSTVEYEKVKVCLRVRSADPKAMT